MSQRDLFHVVAGLVPAIHVLNLSESIRGCPAQGSTRPGMTPCGIPGPCTLPQAIPARRLSPVDVVAAFLDRIAAQDAKLHAFVEVYADEARLAAEAADKAIRSGHAVGPLHGVPIALKDPIEIEGKIVTGGALIWRDRRAKRTATLARALIAQGMIVLGKTHTVEFAYGGWGTNSRMGTPWNPWDPKVPRTPGGSSSGSGVAVAARLAPWAIGTDTGGSVRLPASFCGLTGLKTTIGRVSTYGILPLSPTLDTGSAGARGRGCRAALSRDAGSRSAGSPHARPAAGRSHGSLEAGHPRHAARAAAGCGARRRRRGRARRVRGIARRARPARRRDRGDRIAARLCGGGCAQRPDHGRGSLFDPRRHRGRRKLAARRGRAAAHPRRPRGERARLSDRAAGARSAQARIRGGVRLLRRAAQPDDAHDRHSAGFRRPVED